MNNQVKIYKSSQDLDDIILFVEEQLKSASPYDFTVKLIEGKYDETLLNEKVLLIDPLKRSFPEFKKPHDELSCAIELYKSLDITEEKANDPRLWTFACLGHFRKYIYNKTNCDTTLTQKTFFSYFFFKGSAATTNSRNTISKLWWGVNQTIDKSLKDEFFYTKILFSSAQIFQDLTQRPYIFSNKKILVAFLEFIETKPKKARDKTMKLVTPVFYNHIKTFNTYLSSKEEIISLLNNFNEDFINKGLLE